jgi:hypothetical protein
MDNLALLNSKIDELNVLISNQIPTLCDEIEALSLSISAGANSTRLNPSSTNNAKQLFRDTRGKIMKIRGNIASCVNGKTAEIASTLYSLETGGGVPTNQNLIPCSNTVTINIMNK